MHGALGYRMVAAAWVVSWPNERKGLEVGLLGWMCPPMIPPWSPSGHQGECQDPGIPYAEC